MVQIISNSKSIHKNNAAFLVFTNAELVRSILSWPQGCPLLVMCRWYELKALHCKSSHMTTEDFMWKLIWEYDLRTLELTRCVTYRSRARQREFAVRDIRPAIEAADANAVRLALEFAKPANGALRHAYWTLAIDSFPGHCEVLDELDMFEPLSDADLKVAGTAWGQKLVTVDDVVLVEWFVRNIGMDYVPTDLLHTVALRGNLALVRFLATVGNQVIEPRIFHDVYRNGQQQADNANAYVSIVRFLLQHRRELHTSEFEVDVFNTGDHVTLELVHQTRGLRFLEGVNIDKAAAQGHLQVIQLVASCVKVQCTRDAMDHAAANGHFGVLQFLHNIKAVACTPLAMTNAAAHGHFEIVQFLHWYRKEGCYRSAMDAAAAIGRLDIVQFLHTSRREGCSAKAMTLAAQNGHLDVVQFLHTNRTEGCTTAAFTYPRTKSKRQPNKNQFETGRSILLFLLEHRHENHPKSVEDDAFQYRDLQALQVVQQTRGLQYLQGVNVDDLAGEGNLDLLRFLVQYAAATCTPTAMDTAAAKGHFEMVQYLHATRTIGCTTAAMDMAATFNHWAIVEFLDTNRHEGCTFVVLNAAVRLGRMDLVQRYCQHASRLGLHAAAFVAGAYGHHELQAFLKNYQTPYDC